MLASIRTTAAALLAAQDPRRYVELELLTGDLPVLGLLLEALFGPARR